MIEGESYVVAEQYQLVVEQEDQQIQGHPEQQL
jgi:hypothetical protein